MGHAFDMINRLKMNKEIKQRRDVFPSPTSSNNSKNGFKFKQPTEEDLIRLEIKNRQFLQQQKRERLIAFTVSFAIAIALLGWVYYYWDWPHLIQGFMKQKL